MRLFVNKAWGYGEPNPDHYFLALNYRMTELQGAVALAQLAKLDAGVAAARSRWRTRLTQAAGRMCPGSTRRASRRRRARLLEVLPACRRRRRPGRPAGAGDGSQSCDIASAPRYIQKPAFLCQCFADQRTFGTAAGRSRSRARGRRLPPRNASRDHSRTRPHSRPAVERALRPSSRRLPRAGHRDAASRRLRGGNHERPTNCGSGLSGAGGIAPAYAQAFAVIQRSRSSRSPTSSRGRGAAMAEAYGCKAVRLVSGHGRRRPARRGRSSARHPRPTRRSRLLSDQRGPPCCARSRSADRRRERARDLAGGAHRWREAHHGVEVPLRRGRDPAKR